MQHAWLLFETLIESFSLSKASLLASSRQVFVVVFACAVVAAVFEDGSLEAPEANLRTRVVEAIAL
jgi:hypothetical protein